MFGIHRGFEELLGIHFAETLVSLNIESFASEESDLVEDFQIGKDLDEVFVFLAFVFQDRVNRFFRALEVLEVEADFFDFIEKLGRLSRLEDFE